MAKARKSKPSPSDSQATPTPSPEWPEPIKGELLDAQQADSQNIWLEDIWIASPATTPTKTTTGTNAGQDAAQAAQIDAGNAVSDTPPTPKADDQPPANAATAVRIDAGNASHTTPRDSQPRDNAEPAGRQAGEIDAGNVPASKPEPTAAELTVYAHVRSRLMQHPEWKRVIATVREMRADPKLSGMSAEKRERFIWSEMDRLYPPIQETKSDVSKRQSSADLDESKTASPDTARVSGVSGLDKIPAEWLPLPGNAPLAAEVAWVQANRLYVVEELASGGTRVHLGRAHEAAPSRSAIGWLETSIRSYAKFVEVAAKASGPGADEQEQVRRERMQIEEIRGLLAEMAGNPPAPGR